MRSRITDEVARKAYEFYKQGHSLVEVAKKYEFTASGLSVAFSKRKWPTRPRGPIPERGRHLTASDKEIILKAYSEGNTTIRSLAKSYEVSEGVIRNLLKSFNVQTRRDWSRRRQEDGSIVCIDCSVPITTQNAQKDKYRKSGLISRCRICQRRHIRYKKYKLTYDQLLRRLKIQGYKCPICEGHLEESLLKVDHCHRRKVVRGLLCNDCNVALGYVCDNAETLVRMADYLATADTGSVATRTGVYSCGSTDNEKHRYAVYGITAERFNELKEAQNNVCACCQHFRTTQRAPDLVIEHCHISGRIRGLTCQYCNRAIQHFKDLANRCLRAADYLQQAQEG